MSMTSLRSHMTRITIMNSILCTMYVTKLKLNLIRTPPNLPDIAVIFTIGQGN